MYKEILYIGIDKVRVIVNMKSICVIIIYFDTNIRISNNLRFCSLIFYCRNCICMFR